MKGAQAKPPAPPEVYNRFVKRSVMPGA